MTTENREDSLLDDILLDEKVSLLRDQLLNTCLQDFTRQRRLRSSLYAAMAVAALLLVFVALYPWSTRELPGSATRPAYRVSTSPLSQTERVRTSPAVLSDLVVRTQSLPPTVYAQETAKLARIGNAEMLGSSRTSPAGSYENPIAGASSSSFEPKTGSVSWRRASPRDNVVRSGPRSPPIPCSGPQGCKC